MPDINTSEQQEMVQKSIKTSVEGQGKTIEEAIENALKEMDMKREEVEVEILSEGKEILPGESVMGARAHVRLWPQDKEIEKYKEVLSQFLSKMGVDAHINIRRGAKNEDDPATVIFDIEGEDLGFLIGWRGETLRALQTIYARLLGTKENQPNHYYLDVEGYRYRREMYVENLAQRIAERVRKSGQDYTFDAMHPYERRIVHLALANDKNIWTESIGEEPERRLVVHYNNTSTQT